MSLFWMELYKLMHKRVTIYGGMAIMLFLGLFAFSNLQGEETVVNGERYKSVTAVRKDREITEVYAGIFPTVISQAEIRENIRCLHK